MAWVIILVLILANIFVLYLGNQADKKTSKSNNNTKKIMPMNEDLIEAIYDISCFDLPYTDEELQKIDSILRKIARSDSLSGKQGLGLHNLLWTLKISSRRIAELEEQIDSSNKDKVSNYTKFAKNDTKQKIIKQLIHKKGVIKLVLEGNPLYEKCILGTKKDIQKYIQDNHRICVQQVTSLVKSDLKFDSQNKMYEKFKSDFSLDAIKYKITNAVLDPKDITSFEQILDPGESDNYEASDNKGCNEDSFVINIEASQLEKELINTVRRFTKKSGTLKKGN